MSFNIRFMFEHRVTQETAELSVVKSELAYVVSIQMLYRNALDIHRKHTASHLHVAACVA